MLYGYYSSYVRDSNENVIANGALLLLLLRRRKS